MNDLEYPGKGMAWADFLHHRKRVIQEFVAEGRSYEAIAIVLSMDAEQVRGIYENGATDAASIFSRERLARAAMKHPVPHGVFSK